MNISQYRKLFESFKDLTINVLRDEIRLMDNRFRVSIPFQSKTVDENQVGYFDPKIFSMLGNVSEIDLTSEPLNGQVLKAKANTNKGEIFVPFSDHGVDIPPISPERCMMIDGSHFSNEILNEFAPFMGNETTRHYLNGIVFKQEDDHVLVAATDAYRGRIRHLDSMHLPFRGIFLPREFVLMLLHRGINIKRIGVEEVRENDYLNHVVAELENGELISYDFMYEIENYPDISHLFKREMNREVKFAVKIESGALNQALKKISKLGRKNLTLRLFFNDRGLEITGTNEKDLSMVEEVPYVIRESGDPEYEIHFRMNILRPALNVCDGQILWKFAAPHEPVRIGEEIIVMPLKVS